MPVNPAQTDAQLLTLRTLTDIHDARLRCLSGNRSGVSWFEWVVLFVGAGVVIIVTMFVMIFELQYPFRGQLGITAGDWSVTLAHIQSMDAKDPGSAMHM